MHYSALQLLRLLRQGAGAAKLLLRLLGCWRCSGWVGALQRLLLLLLLLLLRVFRGSSVHRTAKYC